MKLKAIVFTALLALAGSAFAASPAPAASTGMGPGAKHEGPCEKDQAKCQAEAAKFDQWCSANADKCMKLKAWAEHRREACEKNKEKCQERMEKMRERHEERRDMKQDQKNGQPGPNDNQSQPDEPGDDQAPPPPMFY